MLGKGEWLTLKQAREWLQKKNFDRSAIWLRKIIEAKKIAAKKEGSQWFIELGALKAVLKNPPKLEVIIRTVALLILLASAIAWEARAAVEVNVDYIREIESKGNASAFNKTEGAIGAFQIRMPLLDDFQRETGVRVSHKSMFDEARAAHLAIWYLEERIPAMLKSYGYPDTIENRIIAWNCGISCIDSKLPRRTKRFIKKYKALEKKAAKHHAKTNS